MTPSGERIRRKGRHGVFAGKTVWSMPERFEIYIVYKRHYINTLPFLFLFVSHHLAAHVIHLFPTPPAVGPPTQLTDTLALSNSSLAAVYLWLAIAKAVSHCPGRLKLFDAAKMCSTHTHTHTWRHQAASVVWASSLGVERRDTWQINCWYRISHTHFTGTSPLLFMYHFTSVSHDLQWDGLHNRRCFVVLW